MRVNTGSIQIIVVYLVLSKNRITTPFLMGKQMTEDAGKRWIVAGNYQQMKTQMMMLKNGQKSGEEMPIIVQKTANVRREDKLWVHLYFLEERQPQKTIVTGEGFVLPKRKREGVISFRLMNFKAPTRKVETLIQREQLQPYGAKVKEKFASPPFIWHKGKKQYSYCEWDKGIQFQLLVVSEAEAKRIVEQTLDILSFSPDWRFLNDCSPVDESRFPDSTDYVNVLGKKVAFPMERPVVDVTFRHATISVPTINQSFVLYDRTGKLASPITPR